MASWINGIFRERKRAAAVAAATVLCALGAVSVVRMDWASMLPGRASPIDQAALEAAAEHAAFTAPFVALEQENVQVARGETLALVFSRAGANWADVAAAQNAVSKVFNPRRIRPGQEIALFTEVREDADRPRLMGASFRSDPGASVTVARRADGSFFAREIQTPLTYEIARIVSEVDGSIYEAAVEKGATDHEVAALSDVFGYDVDFQRDVHPGDMFELVFERYHDDDNRTVKTGALLYMALETRRGVKGYYRFQAPGDSKPEWYDGEGKTARKFLMKTPINGARLSSGFGVRRHPILGYSLMHKGTDFAAPAGTPIMAAGDGIVAKAGWNGSYGRYVRIDHSAGYGTAYAHLSGVASGVRPGARVRQGQIIGYVGTTGRSTGPHLHYEILYRGAQVNPQSVKAATGRVLSPKELAVFAQERARIDGLRVARKVDEPPVLAASFGVGEPTLRR